MLAHKTYAISILRQSVVGISNLASYIGMYLIYFAHVNSWISFSFLENESVEMILFSHVQVHESPFFFE